MAQTNSGAEVHIHVLGLNPADWSILSSIATILGVFIALYGGYFALRSYRSANRLANHAHMHGLFRDYLRTKFDYQMGLYGTVTSAFAPDPDDPDSEEAAASNAMPDHEDLDSDVASLKLYVLEEMWDWVRRQERRRDKWMWLRRLERRRYTWTWLRRLSERMRLRTQVLEAWRKTILSHVVIDQDDVIENLEWATDCYSMGFLEFLASRMTDEARFAEIHKHQADQIARGDERTAYRLNLSAAA